MPTEVKDDENRPVAASPARTTKVSRKNQVTLPVAALREAGVSSGDVLRVDVVSPGEFRLVLYRDPWWDLFDEVCGAGGVTTRTELEEMRNEWER